MTERWRSVVGYEGLYEVSDLGRVRSVARTEMVTGRFAGRRRRAGRVLAQSFKRYQRVHLSKDGRSTYGLVHRIVLEAFVGPCPLGHEGAHENGDTSENALDNLRWKTHLANDADKDRHGTRPRGERCGSTKLTEEQVRAVLIALRTGAADRALARTYAVDRSTIRAIRLGKTWHHLSLEIADGP